ncbi:unnamed protein product [Absidia cylindrospora]
MNDTNTYLLMEEQTTELRCGGLSGLPPAPDQPSTWLPSSKMNINGSVSHNQSLHTSPSDQQYHQKSMAAAMVSSTHPTAVSQHHQQQQRRRCSFQSSPTPPSMNAMMMMDIPATSSNAVGPYSTTTSSTSSTSSSPPTHYWSTSSGQSALYQSYSPHPYQKQEHHHDLQQQQQHNHHYNQQSLPVTPVQYHQSPFMQSPIVSTTRSHSVKRNKLRQSTYTRWSLEEDELLKQAVAVHGPHKWSLIASHVPNRTPMQCSTRWLGALNPNIHKGRWTEYEDNILKYSVLEYANVTDNQGRIQPIPWNRIADRISNRTGIQCQARWTEALDPYVRKGKWGADEDQLLRSGVKDHGRCWIRIAETIPGRTQRQCRTRWMQLQCKHSKQQQQKQQQQQSTSQATPIVDTTLDPTTTPSSSTSSTSTSASTNGSTALDHNPYSSPSSIDDVVSPSSTDDDNTIMTTGPSPMSANTMLVSGPDHVASSSPHAMPTDKPSHGYYAGNGFDNAMFQHQQQQQHLHHHYQQSPSHQSPTKTASPHPSSINYHHQPIKQVFHAPPLQTSPSDVYTYFNQLSHPPNLFPSHQQ